MPEGSSAVETNEQCTVLITEERVGQEGCFNWKGGRCSGRGGWNVITPPPSDAWSISLHRTQPSTNKPKLRASDWFLQLSPRAENLPVQLWPNFRINFGGLLTFLKKLYTPVERQCASSAVRYLSMDYLFNHKNTQSEHRDKIFLSTRFV